jgi:hypothetical protein
MPNSEGIKQLEEKKPQYEVEYYLKQVQQSLNRAEEAMKRAEERLKRQAP